MQNEEIEEEVNQGFEEIEDLDYDELVEKVENSDNPFLELELMDRIEEKQDEVSRGLDAIGDEE